MSEKEKSAEKPACKIIVNAYGGVEVQAPTKEECIELFKEVTTVRKERLVERDVV